jgi:hypothetical protein
LQISRPLWLQYRQIACWTNRGEDLWKRGVELPGIDVFGDDLKNVGTAVCTENLVRFDLTTESLNVGHNGRADILPLEPVRLDLQAQEPT